MSRRLVRVSNGNIVPGSMANRSAIVRENPVDGNSATDRMSMLRIRLIKMLFRIPYRSAYLPPYCFFTSGSHFWMSEMRVAWLGCELMNSGGSWPDVADIFCQKVMATSGL